MRKHLAVIVALATATMALVAAFPGVASAHERRQVGTLNFVVGFINEPAIVDQPNSIDLTITDSNNQPVADADKTLKAQVVYGGSTEDLTLTPRFGAPGKYNAYFIPTKTGTWRFHFTGSVAGQNVEEVFTSGPGRFNDVASIDSLAFPVKIGDRVSLGSQTSAAKSAADSAKTMAIVALVVGAVGLLAGLAGLGYGLTARRRQRETVGGGASLPRTA